MPRRALRRGAHRGVVFSCLRAAADDRVCHLRAFGWEAGVSFKWREAPTFKSIFTFVIAFSAIVVLIPDVNLLGMC